MPSLRYAPAGRRPTAVEAHLTGGRIRGERLPLYPVGVGHGPRPEAVHAATGHEVPAPPEEDGEGEGPADSREEQVGPPSGGSATRGRGAVRVAEGPQLGRLVGGHIGIGRGRSGNGA